MDIERRMGKFHKYNVDQKKPDAKASIYIKVKIKTAKAIQDIRNQGDDYLAEGAKGVTVWVSEGLAPVPDMVNSLLCVHFVITH